MSENKPLYVTPAESRLIKRGDVHYIERPDGSIVEAGYDSTACRHVFFDPESSPRLVNGDVVAAAWEPDGTPTEIKSRYRTTGKVSDDGNDVMIWPTVKCMYNGGGDLVKDPFTLHMWMTKYIDRLVVNLPLKDPTKYTIEGDNLVFRPNDDTDIDRVVFYVFDLKVYLKGESEPVYSIGYAVLEEVSGHVFTIDRWKDIANKPIVED